MTSRVLSGCSVALLVSCAVYYTVSIFALSTPFDDSLSPLQRQIRSASMRTRGNLFLFGFVVGVMIAFAYDKCVH